MKPHEEVSKAVVQRIGLPWVERQRADDSLKRPAIAKIEAGEERSVITQERDDREARGG
jgi:hypothetical protein